VPKLVAFAKKQCNMLLYTVFSTCNEQVFNKRRDHQGGGRAKKAFLRGFLGFFLPHTYLSTTKGVFLPKWARHEAKQGHMRPTLRHGRPKNGVFHGKGRFFTWDQFLPGWPQCFFCPKKKDMSISFFHKHLFPFFSVGSFFLVDLYC
jgi:hypothetical protein